MKFVFGIRCRPSRSASLGDSGTDQTFVPVTTEMLRNPSPDDWLMFSRTYDAQRFSPLKEINKGNVGQLELAWKIDLPTGTTETIPTVYRGVMYTIVPDGICPRARRGDRHVDLAVQARQRELPIEDSRDLRRHDLLHRARQLRRRAGRADRRSCGGKPRRTRAATRRDRSLSKAKFSPAAVAPADAQAATSAPTTRRPERNSGGSTRSQVRTIPKATSRGAALRSIDAPRPRGRCRAPTIPCDEAHLLGHRQSNAEHARCAARRQFRRDPAFIARGSLQQLHRRAESGHRKARRGTTSICPAMTGTKTSTKSAFCFARPSARIRSL